MGRPVERFLAVPQLDRSGVLTFSPDGRELLYVHDGAGRPNLYRHPLAGAPVQLTDCSAEAVGRCLWSRAGIVFEVDGGAERSQLWRLAPGSRAPLRLAGSPDAGYELAVDAVDPGGRRALVAADLARPGDVGVHELDLESGATRPVVEADGMFEPGPWHPGGRRAVMARVRTNTEREWYMVEVATGAMASLAAELGGGDARVVGFTPDGTGLLAVTDQDSDHRWLARVRLGSRRPEVVWRGDWSVELAAMSRDGRVVAWVVNEDGVHRLHVLAGGRRLAVRALPAGVVHHLAVAPRGDRLAVTLGTPLRGAEVYLAGRTGAAVRRLSDWGATGVPEDELVAPDLVRFPTFDGGLVPAWLYRPRDVAGPTPVVVSVHGGPEAQELPVYRGLYQYLLSRGVGVLAPNIRGSTGYGLAYQRLIYRDWGGGELRDVEAAARHLRSLRWVDGRRLAIMGVSFGGFVVLSALARLPGLWACGVDAFGPSNLVTLTRTVPASWRPLMRAWVGDPVDDAELLRARSPITHVDGIRAPLLVIQGALDPRVVPAESEQVVEALRARGRHVEYMRFADEGHGLTGRANQLRSASLTASFLLRHLGVSA
jgi:dipeptidyl aminopeptidase/acylaminoacyl peptidase